MREIDKIVVHCTATPEGRPHTVKEVRAWHKAKGWKDIGLAYVPN
jgi:N-acetylmuramoyl-L-alanine amidase